MSESLAFFLDPDEARKVAQTTGRPKGKKIRTYTTGCVDCPGEKNARSPRMPASGKGRKRIMVVGEGPGRNEDEVGIQFVGRSGQFLSENLRLFGIELELDCFKTNAVQCAIPERDKKQLLQKCRTRCLPRLEKQIKEASPKLILCLGGPAVQSVLDPPPKASITKLRGRIIPSWKHNCWVACLFHPAYILRDESRSQMGTQGESDLRRLFQKDMRAALGYLDNPLSDVPRLAEQDFRYVSDVAEAIQVMADLSRSETAVAIDYETTGLDTFADEFALLSVAFAVDNEDGSIRRWFIPLRYRGHWTKAELAAIENSLKRFLTSAAPKLCQSWDYENKASLGALGVPCEGVTHDTMVGNHLLDERKGTCGLEFQTFVNFGVRYKSKVDFSKSRVVLDSLPSYNSLDAGYTLLLSKTQRRSLMAEPSQEAAYQFVHRALPVLSAMSEAGIRVDRKALIEMQEETEEEMEQVMLRLEQNPAARQYRKKKGRLPKFTSNDDLRELLFVFLKIPAVKVLQSGSSSVDEEALKLLLAEEKTDLSEDEKSLIEGVMRLRKLGKFSGTYVKNLLELSGEKGVLHPSYHLHVAETYRSSSSNPNWQNQPIRDPEFAKIRRAVVPLRGDLFVEADYSGAEVRVLAMYSKDKTLIEYLNAGVDFHRQWASRIFQIREEDVTPEQRYLAKNQFVFPSFYGAVPQSIAKSFDMDVDVAVALQNRLWSEFPDVKRWQRKVLEFYRRNGYVETFLGFRRRAPLDENQIINMPIQATAFHLLLDGTVRAHYQMQEAGLKSRLVSEIHDSVLTDTFENEVEDVIVAIADALETKRYDWEGDVRMVCDWKIGENWLEMEEIDV